jgi:hypothetical protein
MVAPPQLKRASLPNLINIERSKLKCRPYPSHWRPLGVCGCMSGCGTALEIQNAHRVDNTFWMKLKLDCIQGPRHDQTGIHRTLGMNEGLAHQATECCSSVWGAFSSHVGSTGAISVHARRPRKSGLVGTSTSFPEPCPRDKCQIIADLAKVWNAFSV